MPLLLLAAIPSTAFAVDGDAGDDTGAALSLGVRIADAAEAGTTDPAELAEAVSLSTEGPGSLTFDAEQRIVATVFFESAPDEALLAAVGSLAEVDAVSSLFLGATVRVAPANLTALAELPGVVSATPALSPFTASDLGAGVLSQAGVLQAAETPGGDACGPIPIDADIPLRSAEARERFGADGTGVTVGVISDSFADTTTPTSWADDVASGALPGPGNPCGREQAVEVLQDEPYIPRQGDDEGRAMAQLVHGIAPGASIKFASAGASQLQMAQNIVRLAEAGAQIIVDDITWGDESYYQQGFISAAIELVKRDYGVTYFTSAGNSTGVGNAGASDGKPVNSWQTVAYRPMACPSWVIYGPADPLDSATGYDCLDFDPDGATEQAYDTLQTKQFTAPMASLRLLSSIGEPLFGVTTSYEVRMYLVDPSTQTTTFLGGVSSFGAPLPGLMGNIDVPSSSELRMVMVRTEHDPAQTREPAVFLGMIRGGDAIASRQFMGNQTTDWVGESVFGHSGDGSGLSVASLNWENPQEVRPYSSLGPGTMLFEPASLTSATPAARLAAPQLVDAPHIAAVDGMQTTFFGEDTGTPQDPEYRFFGTSAAAPAAAAVAALGLSYNPAVANAPAGDRLGDLVVQTARGTAAGGPVNPYDPSIFSDIEVFGTGIVDATALLERMYEMDPEPAQPAGLASSVVKHDQFSVAWQASTAVDHYVIALYEAAAGQGAPAADAPVAGAPIGTVILAEQLPGNASAYSFTGLQPKRDYVVELTAYSALNKPSRSSLLSVTTAAAPTPKPKPEPKPEPTNNKGGTLSNTGGQNMVGWYIGAGALVILGGAAVLIASRKRAASARQAAAEGSSSETTDSES